jgi:rod shape-determining protein MreC
MNSRLTVLWGVLLLLSLLLTRFAPEAPLAISSGLRAPLAIIYDPALALRQGIEAFTDWRNLRRENVSLQIQLAQRENQLRATIAERDRLASAARIRKTQSQGVRDTAAVIAVSSDALTRTITIDKGFSDGVKTRMIVTTEKGLVGWVDDLTQTEATVRTLIDPQFRVSIRIGNTSGKALAYGDGAGHLRADDVALNLKVAVGDSVTTLSVSGGVFPAGVKIGTISQILPTSPNSLGQTVFIDPAVDVAALDQVFLINPS